MSSVKLNDEVHHKAIERGPKRATTWHCGQVTFEAPEGIEGGEVIVVADVNDEKVELRAVDKLPFIIARSNRQSLRYTSSLGCTHELARDRELMQFRPTLDLQSLVADA